MGHTKEEHDAHLAEVTARLLPRFFRPVHVQGGPCVGSAPEDEEFVAVDTSPYAAYARVTAAIDLNNRITCPLCKVALALTDNDTGVNEPSEYARRLVVAHAFVSPAKFMHPHGYVQVFGYGYLCGGDRKRAPGVNAPPTYAYGLLFDLKGPDDPQIVNVTCKICIARLVEIGWLKK